MQARLLQEFHLTLNSSMEQINLCLQAMIECLCPNHNFCDKAATKHSLLCSHNPSSWSCVLNGFLVTGMKKGDTEDLDATALGYDIGYNSHGQKDKDIQEPDDQSPIEEVALTVATTDDTTLPVYTFRMWTLGIISCVLLAFLNQFFSYRIEPLQVTALSAQIATLPLGRLMATFLPTTVWKVPFTNWRGSLNPGPFNMKEHVLITIFANAGAGGAYAINIVTIVKIFYKRRMTFFVGLLITITTQVRISNLMRLNSFQVLQNPLTKSSRPLIT